MFFTTPCAQFMYTTFILMFSLPLQAAKLPLISIKEFSKIEDKIKRYIRKKEDIQESSQGQNTPPTVGVIWDLHGVLVKQVIQPPASEEAHGPLLTLRKGATEILQFLKENQIPYVVATAWNDFKPVLKEVANLEFAHLLNIEDSLIHQENWTVLKKFSLGEDKKGNPLKLKGHKIGRFMHLKFAAHFKEENYEEDNPYFRQKIFALEAGCSEEEKVNFSELKYIIVIDDSDYNLRIAEEDFSSSIHHKYGTKLKLFFFQPPIDEDSESSSSSESSEVPIEEREASAAQIQEAE